MLIATVPLKVLSGVGSFFCVHFHEKTWNRPSGVCGREYSLVVDGGVDAAQFKQQLVHPALGQLAHDEQTVAGDGCRSAAGFGYAAGSGNGEAPAGASAPKAAVRLAGTDVPGAAGMPAGTARPDAIAPSVLWYIETGICSQCSFSRDATGFIF